MAGRIAASGIVAIAAFTDGSLAIGEQVAAGQVAAVEDWPGQHHDPYLENGAVATTASGGEPVAADTGLAWPSWRVVYEARELAPWHAEPSEADPQ